MHRRYTLHDTMCYRDPIDSAGVIVFKNQGGGINGKISGTEKRREKEISKNAQRETAREKGQEGVQKVIAFSFTKNIRQQTENLYKVVQRMLSQPGLQK